MFWTWSSQLPWRRKGSIRGVGGKKSRVERVAYEVAFNLFMTERADEERQHKKAKRSWDEARTVTLPERYSCVDRKWLGNMRKRKINLLRGGDEGKVWNHKNNTKLWKGNSESELRRGR